MARRPGREGSERMPASSVVTREASPLSHDRAHRFLQAAVKVTVDLLSEE